MTNLTIIIGISASVFTAVASTPQLLKIIKEKNAENISLLMIAILLTGLACWIYYGLLIHDLIVIIANAFSFLINALLIMLALKFKKSEKR